MDEDIYAVSVVCRIFRQMSDFEKSVGYRAILCKLVGFWIHVMTK